MARGLLPAAELRTLAGKPSANHNRDDFEPLALSDGGVAVLRFQQMQDVRLTQSLAGAYAGNPAAWRGMIDQHVFFWATEARRDKFLAATKRMRAVSKTAPGSAGPAVMCFDTLTLLGFNPSTTLFSTFNTGSTVLGGRRAPRDEHTFRPIGDYKSGPAAELAIRGALPPALLARARLA